MRIKVLPCLIGAEKISVSATILCLMKVTLRIQSQSLPDKLERSGNFIDTWVMFFLSYHHLEWAMPCQALSTATQALAKCAKGWFSAS
jgi:hypothetical protein